MDPNKHPLAIFQGFDIKMHMLADVGIFHARYHDWLILEGCPLKRTAFQANCGWSSWSNVSGHIWRQWHGNHWIACINMMQVTSRSLQGEDVFAMDVDKVEATLGRLEDQYEYEGEAND